MWILQWYIFRELFKAMILTTIGMTLVFTLGGGVANMVKGVNITSYELLQILGFMLPVATTLTLPVAALLSTTNVYGRLSADNEFVACRASGINIHRLLLSALIVALAVGAFTFYFSNYVIPSFIREIEAKARKSIDQMVSRKLEMDKFIKVQDFVFHADQVRHVRGAGEDIDKDYLRIAGAAFIELEDGDAIRFGTAPEAVIEFDKSDRVPSVRAQMYDVSLFDRSRLQFGRMGSQPFGPMPVPGTLEMKAKWLNLPDLLRYREVPAEIPEIIGQLKNLRQLMIRQVCYDQIIRSLREGRDWQAGDGEVTYTVKADPECLFQKSKDEGQPVFKNLTIVENSPEGQRTYKAGAGSIRVTKIFGLVVPKVSIVLEDGISVIKKGEPTVEKLKLELRSVPIPEQYVQMADKYADELAQGSDAPLSLGEKVGDAREQIKRELGLQVRTIIGIIHARAAFSISCMVLIILGAVLGIIFRGGQALVSFGLSCIPFAVVIVTIIMGRQMAQNEGTELIGLTILWTGIALVFVVDMLMLFRWLRR
ncbi:MAG: LptF/LptG family permease [Phycisphaerae bacterium]|nr:LptF/LptG family permease [Phycisphaerae bacterium]